MRPSLMVCTRHRDTTPRTSKIMPERRRNRDLEQLTCQCIDSHLLGLSAGTVNGRSAASLNRWRTKQEQA